MEIPGEANVEIVQNELNNHLVLKADRVFKIRDENALIKNLGLPKTTDEDIRRVFDEDVA